MPSLVAANVDGMPSSEAAARKASFCSDTLTNVSALHLGHPGAGR